MEAQTFVYEIHVVQMLLLGYLQHEVLSAEALVIQGLVSHLRVEPKLVCRNEGPLRCLLVSVVAQRRAAVVQRRGTRVAGVEGEVSA